MCVCPWIACAQPADAYHGRVLLCALAAAFHVHLQHVLCEPCAAGCAPLCCRPRVLCTMWPDKAICQSQIVRAPRDSGAHTSACTRYCTQASTRASGNCIRCCMRLCVACSGAAAFAGSSVSSATPPCQEWCNYPHQLAHQMMCKPIGSDRALVQNMCLCGRSCVPSSMPSLGVTRCTTSQHSSSCSSCCASGGQKGVLHACRIRCASGGHQVRIRCASGAHQVGIRWAKGCAARMPCVAGTAPGHPSRASCKAAGCLNARTVAQQPPRHAQQAQPSLVHATAQWLLLRHRAGREQSSAACNLRRTREASVQLLRVGSEQVCFVSSVAWTDYSSAACAI